MSIIDTIRRRLSSPRPNAVDESRRSFLRGLMTSSAAVVVAPAVALDALDAMAHESRTFVDVAMPAERHVWINHPDTQLWNCMTADEIVAQVGEMIEQLRVQPIPPFSQFTPMSRCWAR